MWHSMYDDVCVQGIYTLRFFKQGQWRNVVIDDRIVSTPYEKNIFLWKKTFFKQRQWRNVVLDDRIVSTPYKKKKASV